MSKKIIAIKERIIEVGFYDSRIRSTCTVNEKPYAVPMSVGILYASVDINGDVCKFYLKKDFLILNMIGLSWVNNKLKKKEVKFLNLLTCSWSDLEDSYVKPARTNQKYSLGSILLTYALSILPYYVEPKFKSLALLTCMGAFVFSQLCHFEYLGNIKELKRVERVYNFYHQESLE